MAGTGNDVVYEFEARSVGKMRCGVDVKMLTPFDEEVEVVTDEGPAIGGFDADGVRDET